MAAKKQNTTEKVVNKKRLTGQVIRLNMPSMPIVKVSTKFAHPKYKKVIETWKNYHAHNELKLEVGDFVVIEETKPISKTKRWMVIEKLDRKH
jgi:small subunit ribosomal protein S17